MTAIAICGAAVKAGENVYVIVGVVWPIVTAVPGEFTCTTDAAWTYGHGFQIGGIFAQQQWPTTTKISNNNLNLCLDVSIFDENRFIMYDW